MMFKHLIEKSRRAILTLGLIAGSVGFAHAAKSNNILVGEVGVSTSTNFVLIDSGAGTLYDIAVASGTAASYAVCFDSASVTGLTLGADGTASAPRIAQVVVTATSTTYHSHGGYPISIHYNNGLACANSEARHTAVYYKPED